MSGNNIQSMSLYHLNATMATHKKKTVNCQNMLKGKPFDFANVLFFVHFFSPFNLIN